MNLFNGKNEDDPLDTLNTMMSGIISKVINEANRKGHIVPSTVLTQSNRLMVQIKKILNPEPEAPAEQKYTMTAAQLQRIEVLLQAIDDRPFILKGKELIFKEGKNKGDFADWLRRVVEAGERIKGNG